MDKKIRILQWNCRSLGSKIDEFREFLRKDTPEIIMLQEVKHRQSQRTLQIQGYQFPPFEDGSGRIATYVKKDVMASEYEIINSNLIHNLGVEIQLKDGKKVKCTNVYIPNSQNYTTIQMQDLQRVLDSGHIVGGDFNAHSPMWDDSLGAPSAAGKKLEEGLDITNKVVLNSGEPTHMYQAGDQDRLNALDLTLCSNQLAAQTRWKCISHNAMGSDHFPIITEIIYRSEEDSDEEIGLQTRLSTKNTNWDKYHSLTGVEVNIETTDSLEAKTTKITNKIIESIKASTPQGSGIKGNYLGKSWWNEDCRVIIRCRNRALNRWKRRRDAQSRQEYLRLKYEAKRTVANAKKSAWHAFTETLNANSPITNTWKILRKMTNGPTPDMPSLKENETSYVTNKEKSEILAKTFQKISSNENLNQDTMEKRKETQEKVQNLHQVTRDPNNLDSEITMMELARALRSKGKSSAPGPDMITYEMIKKSNPKLKKQIVSLFNELLQEGLYPDQWKTAIVIPLPKPGKPKTSPSSYRPIALTSQLGKTLETIIKNRMSFHLEKEGILPPQQSGFRKGRSTTDHITRLAQKIENMKTRSDRLLIGIFLDIEKAYDMLWREGLLLKLNQYNIPQKTWSLVQSFLSNRRIKVRVKNELSNEKVLDNGVPQGSVLSPLLFITMLADLTRTSKSSDLMQFADDTSILKEISVIERKNNTPLQYPGLESLQKDLDRVADWFMNNGFKLSQEKTQAIVFHKPRIKTSKVEGLPELTLYGEKIQYTSQVKFLGVTFTNKGLYGPYVDHLVAQGRRGINLLRAVSGHTWGAHPKSLLNIFHAHVMSRLLYAAPVLNYLNKAQLEKLRTVQTIALKVVLGVPKGAHNAAVYAESGQLPIDLIVKKRTAAYYYKILSNSDDHPSKQILSETERLLGHERNIPKIRKEIETLEEKGNIEYQEIGENSSPSRDRPPWTILQPKVDLSLTKYNKNEEPHIIKAELRQTLEEKYSSHVCLYTDGSHNPNTGKTGMGVYCENFVGIVGSLPDNTSVYRSELAAIKAAVNFIDIYEQEIEPHNSYLIISDCLSVLQTIEKGIDFSEGTEEIDIALGIDNHRKNGKDITLKWAPSHIGILGNEMADKLAKQATSEEEISNEIIQTIRFSADISPTPQEKSNRLNKVIEKEWEMRYQENVKGRRADLDAPPDKKLTMFGRNRKDQARISRIRTNSEYCNFRRNKPQCQCECGELVSPEHILIDCALTKRDEITRILGEEEMQFTMKNLVNPPKGIWNKLLTAVIEAMNEHPDKDNI